MHFSQIFLVALAACISTSIASSNRGPSSSLNTKSFHRRSSPVISKPKYFKRGEPETGEDLPDAEPHPNQLDKVETAFKDAIELTSSVKLFIDTDTTIFPHYFADKDRAEITRIFTSINNNDQGNDYLSKILVQVTDRDGRCDSITLAYSGDYNTEAPFIVLCPTVFKKKAITALNGKSPQDPDGNNFYAMCTNNGGDIDQNVSYVRTHLFLKIFALTNFSPT